MADWRSLPTMLLAVLVCTAAGVAIFRRPFEARRVASEREAVRLILKNATACQDLESDLYTLWRGPLSDYAFDSTASRREGIRHSLDLQQRLLDTLRIPPGSLRKLFVAESALCSLGLDPHGNVLGFGVAQEQLSAAFEAARAEARSDLGLEVFVPVAETPTGPAVSLPAPEPSTTIDVTPRPSAPEEAAPAAGPGPELRIYQSPSPPAADPNRAALARAVEQVRRAREAREATPAAPVATSAEISQWLAPHRQTLAWALGELGEVNVILKRPNPQVAEACPRAQKVADRLASELGPGRPPQSGAADALEWVEQGVSLCGGNSALSAILRFGKARAALSRLLDG